MASSYKECIGTFLDLVYPRNCAVCGGMVEDNPLGVRYVCAGCRMRLYYVGLFYCERCGYPYVGGVSAGRVCAKCEELKPVFEAGRSIILHRGTGAELVRAVKYRSARYLLPDIERILLQCSELGEYIGEAVLVPVPLCRVRFRERGFNQAELFAQLFMRVGGAGRVENLLCRVKDTESQTHLSREERMANVKNAFAMRPGFRLEDGVCYVLVDDVYTTGSTLNVCAQELLRAGAERVKVLTLAHG
jgi:competence protein ComFC